MDYRKCTHCKQIKSLDFFHKCKGKGFKFGVYPKCKECRKIFTKIDYEKRKKKIIKYLKKYRKTEQGKITRKKEFLNRKKNHFNKYRANYLTSNAIRDKRLIRIPCEKCGDKKSQAHHPDYDEPLKVIWLCKKHHNEIHKKQ